MTDQDPTLAWVQAIHRDLTTLKDNHLAHVDADLQAMKRDIADIKADLDEVKPVLDNIRLFTSRFGRKMLLVVLVSISFTIGTPMGMEML
jgi:hypothetical protein